jgi:hypothetical protein
LPEILQPRAGVARQPVFDYFFLCLHVVFSPENRCRGAAQAEFS